MKSKIIIETGKAIRLRKGAKYLLILPRIANSKELSTALTEFFGDIKFFAIESKDVNAVKIAEFMEAHE
jgi:hypothetical protein